MAVVAFEGPAGSGKTHRLMHELAATLQTRPLAPHQRVLALTYMHGSRRRLDARLRAVPQLAGKYEATTLDSFARRLTQRWARLAEHLGHPLPVEGEFTNTCRLAATLLEQPTVRDWVEMSFPILVVDEAQDLSPERSSMIAARATSGTTLLAFDEFQCLNTALLPIAIESWLHTHCKPTPLTGSRRTSNGELIQAACAIRDGRKVPTVGWTFKVFSAPSTNLAATFVSNGIAWRKPSAGNLAILTPSRAGGFADNVVARVRQGPVGKHKNGPYQLHWERNDDQEASELWDKLEIADGCSVTEAIERLSAHRQVTSAKMLREWLLLKRSATGLSTVESLQLKRQLDRIISLRRNFGSRTEPVLAAMTIQQAKNREFDHVMVLWPYTVPDNAEQKRRLLYNAVTRARYTCTILVQNEEMLRAPPFVR